ncbi:recombinase RecT [Roseinatronobacter sp. NSM]|uniref:recombinase RecT n=1 Tax=Roseinatronobacter sp. NSM TaxID=3457785 RepID=UPI0040356023
MSAIVSTKPLRQVQQVRELLSNTAARDQLSAVAAKHMNPERMMRVVANAIRTTPKLQQCEPMSFLGALMQCASLGLEPNTILGHAYLIPFDKKEKNDRTGKWEVVRTDVQLIVGYKGLIDLARRSGHITSLSANIHYSDDELWEYEEGTEARLRHRPGPMEGAKLHAYAIAKFKDGGHAYVVLPWAHVMKIRDGSQGWQSAVKFKKTADSPWLKHEDEMAKKTAIRALAKYLPLSVEFMDAMTVDDSKADYRAFAMDPSAGIAPIEDDYIEGEADEQAIEQSRTDQESTAPKPQQNKAEKPTEAEKRTTQSRPDQEQERPSRHKKVEPSFDGQLPLGGDEDAPEVDLERWEALADMIIDEVKDSSPDEVEEMYGDQITQMEGTPALKKLAARVRAAIDAKK